ncbi:glycosyltransferase family 4 protein [Candidatus Woesearchaeota archaeon]|nr:glycosyltransferase family 4 protein [Candidatus Woesearchaeota archaeon]
MKIAILTPTFSHFSGIDRLVEIQAKKFIKQGHKVDIFALQASLKLPNVNVFVLGMPKNPFMERIYRLFMFLDRKKVEKYAKMLQSYDIVYSHFYPMNIIAYKAKKEGRKIKYVYHNAGVGIVSTYSFFERLYLHLFNIFSNWTVKNCDEAISISEFLRKTLRKETGIDSKVEYIPVDTKRFNKKVSGKRIRKKFGIRDGPVLLYVGRISPHKGIHLLLKAFALVQKEYPRAKLIIAGKHTFKKYSEKLKRLAGRNVMFAGFVPDKDLPEYYAACDIYTSCSLWEGYDIPIVEAFYSGKPSIAFDVGSHPEVLKKGKLVKESDVEAFAKAIMFYVKKK